MKKFSFLFLVFFMINVNAGYDTGIFTPAEITLIGNETDVKMRLLTVDNREDSVFLRKRCLDVNPAETGSEVFRILHSRMLATVTDPENQGVGIAAPQIGLNRRIIIVQRFDKEGEPFEIYVNPEITYRSAGAHVGREGCLSVPGSSGDVLRYDTIGVSYVDAGGVKNISETVVGFTAVIFQHEIDHLEGILYTDKKEKEE